MSWYQSLGPLQLIFFYMAIPATLILVIQTILLLIGLGHGPDADMFVPDAHDLDVHDFDAHDMDAHDLDSHEFDAHDASHVHADSGLRVFTVRGLVAFFTICGWSGLAMAANGMNSFLVCLLAIVFGSVALVGVAMILKASLKLQQSGNVNIINAVGKIGQVYIPIPPGSSGTGKIMAEVQGRLLELSAMTKEPQKLKTGQNVKVTGVVGEILLVEPAEENEMNNAEA